MQSGLYKVKFDASKLTSGIYFYKLTGSSFNQTRKMVLIK
ncbi:MAG: T9SS type A sorting domain-containing protein [Ignavibacteria bacterium]